MRLIKKILSRISRSIQFQNQFSGDIHFPKTAIIEGSSLSGTIILGDNTIIHKGELTGNITIGRFSTLWGPDTLVNGNVEIGSFCSIASNCNIISYDHNHKRITSYFILKNFFKEKNAIEITTRGPISIGSDVWIGSNTVILGGVKINHGAIVAGGAVVTKDVAPYSIVAGNPANEIGKRFEDDIVNRLLKLEWWNWPEEKLNSKKKIFENELTLDLLAQLEFETNDF
jgi:virginiamycin A acetyltransferase